MKRRRLGVYAGSFDPPTLGHLWMIEQGVRLFDRLVVAIGINPDKEPTFSVEDRTEMLRDATKRFRDLSVTTFSNRYLIRYAQSLQGVDTGVPRMPMRPATAEQEAKIKPALEAVLKLAESLS